MIRKIKSPNIRSTTGRAPVMAAPTAIPIKPGSAIGVSTTRPVPNSSTRPDRTLNGVPASATSSPRMNTVSSRRISSASASFTAWDRVISRISISSVREHMHVDLVGRRVGRFFGVGHGVGRVLFNLGIHRVDLFLGRDAFAHQMGAEPDDRILVFLPILLFILGAVVFAVDVADVVAVVAVGHQFDEKRAFALPGAGD